MNIFVLDENPITAASYIDDQRLSKMIIESGQMMRAALGRHGLTEEKCIEYGILTSKGTPWKITHKNHPCTLWAGDSWANFDWLANHAIGLCVEFKSRFGKTHACEEPILLMNHLHLKQYKKDKLTPFALAMPDKFRPLELVTGYFGMKDKLEAKYLSHASGNIAVTTYRNYYQSKDNIRYKTIPFPNWWQGIEVTA